MKEYGNSQGRVGVSQASEFNQNADIQAPQMESYNPAHEDYNQPYIPPSQVGQGNRNYMSHQAPVGYMPQQTNFQQPMHMANQYPQQGMYGYQQQAMPNVQAMNQQAEQAQRAAALNGPNGMSAYRNLERMDQVIDQIGGIASATRADSSDVNQYAIGVAIDALHTAINVLGDVDVWMPQAKSQLTPKLQNSAIPIIKALKSYVSVIERMQ